MSLVTANSYGFASLTFVSPLYQPTNLWSLSAVAVSVTLLPFSMVEVNGDTLPPSPAVAVTV